MGVHPCLSSNCHEYLKLSKMPKRKEIDYIEKLSTSSLEFYHETFSYCLLFHMDTLLKIDRFEDPGTGYAPT
jgi:hypothetical protein